MWLPAKVETQNLASHEGLYAVVDSGLIAWVYWYGQDGRRKILRLYWAGAVAVVRSYPHRQGAVLGAFHYLAFARTFVVDAA